MKLFLEIKAAIDNGHEVIFRRAFERPDAMEIMVADRERSRYILHTLTINEMSAMQEGCSDEPAVLSLFAARVKLKKAVVG